MVSKDGAFLGKPNEGGRRKINMAGIHPRKCTIVKKCCFDTGPMSQTFGQCLELAGMERNFGCTMRTKVDKDLLNWAASHHHKTSI